MTFIKERTPRNKISKAENHLKVILKKLDISFEAQKLVCCSNRHYRVDFLIEPNTVVEVDGACHNSSDSK